MTLEALSDHIIIKQDRSPEKSAGGIVFPSQTDLAQGVVLAVGPKVDSVKVGDRVMYTPNGGQKFPVDGEEVTVIEEQDLFGVLQD